MKLLLTLPLLSLSLMVSGCPSTPAAPDATPCTMEMQWGPVRDTEFQPFLTNDSAELTKGFQGFLYVLSTLSMVTEDDPTGAQIVFQIDVDGQEIYTVRQPVTDTVSAPNADGVRYFDEARPRFDDIPLPDLIGRNTTITTSLRVGECLGVFVVDLVLVDEETCIEEEDGSFTCT